MIRYNNISRPVHDSNDPPATTLPKIWGHDLQPPGLTTLDSNGKEAFSRRKELKDFKTGRRRKIIVNNNKNETTELDATTNERGIIGLTSKRNNKRNNGG